MVFRFSLLVLCFGGAYAALLFNLYDVQLNQAEKYLVKAESQITAGSSLVASRGAVYLEDRNGNRLPAVTNKDFPLIFAVPKEIDDPLEMAHKLEEILGLSARELIPQLDRPKDEYRLLIRKAGKEAVQKLEKENLRGIYVQTVPQRFYPFGSLAAHILGFAAPSDRELGQVGRYGVEEYYNERLTGISGEVRGGKIIPPEPGKSLVLTVDHNIQIEAERILERLVQAHRAKGGTVIVQEPRTGKILAMGSYPSFDPNSYSQFPLTRFLNPATQALYEPGSVFKVITLAAALDAGKIEPETRYTDTGQLVVSGRTIRNWDLKAYGTVTMATVLEKSLNTGAAFAERLLGHAAFLAYLERFGFGDKTGIDLPGELAGNLNRLMERSAPEVAFATASFGQGVAVTPVEMIAAFSAIANGGKLMQPYLNADASPRFVRQVIGEEAARQITDMMVGAVDKAEIARLRGYTLAGKTGTAQVPERGGYSDRVINTYIGFGPASNPRFVILFKLDEPEGAPLAGATVVPAFRDLAQFLINYYNIPPDRTEN